MASQTTQIEDVVSKAKEYVKEYMSHYDASHDWSHIERVLALSHKLAASERKLQPTITLNQNLIILSALLHDVGDKKYLPPGQTGETMVKNYLLSIGAAQSLAENVQTICTNVSYTNETANMPAVKELCVTIPELAIVQDADRLDAIGAVGVGRLFAYGGAKAQERGLSVEHFYTKLLKIQERMKTESGRVLAEERTERLRMFLGWWDEETGVVGE
jgi:uncharacterized protein